LILLVPSQTTQSFSGRLIVYSICGAASLQRKRWASQMPGVDLDTNVGKQLTIEVNCGKNANVDITRVGDNDLASVLADPKRFF